MYKVFKKSDIGIPSVTEEGGLHIIREVQRPDHVVNTSMNKNAPTFVQHVNKK